MTKEEYEKICTQYGEPLTRCAIEILNQYIGSTGKKYKSHYMTMIGWPIKEACKRNPEMFRKFKEENASSDKNENPYQEYMG